jgi:hypothetical protein
MIKIISGKFSSPHDSLLSLIYLRTKKSLAVLPRIHSWQ